jgi:deazaflavin-dependent oxidoreductase (nitroreductase family)
MAIDGGQQFCYLTTTGRKSGLPRQIEIWFVEDEGRVYILAEHGLKAKWVQNIISNPNVRIRIGDREYNATARVLDPEKDGERYSRAQDLERKKYDWGDGLPVEFTLLDV